jgi:hypothetical protein
MNKEKKAVAKKAMRAKKPDRERPPTSGKK